MKVAFVIYSCCPGGAEIFVKYLAKSLIEKGINIEIWVITKMDDIASGNYEKLKFEKEFVKELLDESIPVYFIGKRPKKDWRKVRKKLQELYITSKPDIIHCHLEHVTFHTTRALSKFNVPIIQTIHNVKLQYPFLQKYYFKNKISCFIAISNKIKNILIHKLKLPEEKVYLIYNGINLSLFKERKRVIKEKVNNIIIIGRLAQQKDHFTLLKAMAILKKKLDIEGELLPKLFIVGEGPLKSKLKRFSERLSLSEFIYFLGVRKDIPELLFSTDIYVMSSAWEGLSISLMEALASGIPIVTTDAGSNNEIIDNEINGIIVPVRDSQALADGIYKLITDYNIRKKFCIAAQIKAEQFAIEKSAENYEKLYCKILKNNDK